MSTITFDPQIMSGKPIIQGTRITVELILELMTGGWEVQQILEEYPQLTETDIRAALGYANNRIRNEQVSFLVSDKSDTDYEASS